MSPEEKQKINRRKQKEKEKGKLLRSNKWICNDCGFIGKPKKRKRGSWIICILAFTIAFPLVVLIIALSMAEGLLRMLTFSAPQSIIWNIGFGKFFPRIPYKLYGCTDCGHEASMKKIKTKEGKRVFERFDREHFIMRR